MKTRIIVICYLLSAISELALAQGTAFTYQGQLNDGANPANGSYDLRFAIYDAAGAGTQQGNLITNSATGVTNGLFTVTLDFGNQFAGAARWLEIAVRTNGNGAFTALAPRQALTPTPYSISASYLSGLLPATQLSGQLPDINFGGTYGATLTFNNGANTYYGYNFYGGNFTGNGVGLYNLNATELLNGTVPLARLSGITSNQLDAATWQLATNSSGGNATTLNGLTAANFWQLGGNTVSAGQFLGSANGQSLEFRIGSQRALLLTPSSTDAPNLIGGAPVNLVDPGVQGAVIAGGGTTNFLGQSSSNRISADFSSIGGGSGNWIQSGADHSTIGNGWNNLISAGAYESVIAGGDGNVMAGQYSFIGGGNQNTNIASYATVAGGEFNMSAGDLATVSGGLGNTSGGDLATVSGGLDNTSGGYSAVVPGGFDNLASGDYSFAAGNQAKAIHNGTFVWADSQTVNFVSTGSDQFLIRAQGGVGINTSNPGGASLYARGNRTNGWQNSVGWFENTSLATNAAPALRVFVDNGARTPDGALSVSANVTASSPNSLIAEFGNASSFVVVITNDGTIYSKGVALTSDRNAKENFTTLDGKTILAKVVSMPVTQWNYREDSAGKRHIGPVAQDFHTAFGLNGDDDTHISVVDEGGVALAAIQGLNEKVEVRDQKSEVRIQTLEAENAELKQRLETLEQIVLKQKSN